MRFFFQLPNSGLSNLKICQSKKKSRDFRLNENLAQNSHTDLCLTTKKLELTLT